MPARFSLLNGLVAATTVVVVAGHFALPERPVVEELLAAPTFRAPAYLDSAVATLTDDEEREIRVASRTTRALSAFASSVRGLSHPRALESALRSYFAFQASHPDEVKKPLLYFVDYGLPSTSPRGYVFDMKQLKVVDGPFTVAHGRGSASGRFGIPTRFSNRPGSAATSLGLYLAQETYSFRGSAGGQRYRSIGLRLRGLSGDWNDNARMRGVVAHGAPYVAPSRAGRSEGCPAMEQDRARKLLPALANGGLVFLFAPDDTWLRDDPWASTTG